MSQGNSPEVPVDRERRRMMRRRIFAGLALGMLVLIIRPGAAQEKVPPPKQEPLPPGKKEAPPPLLAPFPPPPPGSRCIKALILDRMVPIQRLVPREVITEVRTPGQEVAYREEKCVITEMVVKSREITRQVPCTVMKPVLEGCAETGQCTTVMQPCVEMKTVKDTEFYTEPETRTVVVPVPYLKPVEVVVPRKTIVLEYRTILEKRQQAVLVPAEIPQERMVITPKPPCCLDEHP
jgi:hypothetical protein